MDRDVPVQVLEIQGNHPSECLKNETDLGQCGHLKAGVSNVPFQPEQVKDEPESPVSGPEQLRSFQPPTKTPTPR